MKLPDRINQFGADVTSTPEGRTRGIKIGVAAGMLVLALGVGAFRMLGSSQPEQRREATPAIAAEVEKMAEELEQATAEETEAFEEAVAAGEIAPTAPPEKAVRTHPKGVGYAPGYEPSQAPAPEPDEPDEPETPESDDPG